MVDGDIILAGLTILLGQRGIEAQELDAAQIVEDGGQPIVVALLEHAPPTITLLITTVGLDATTVPLDSLPLASLRFEYIGPDLFGRQLDDLRDRKHLLRRYAFPLMDCLPGDAAGAGDFRLQVRVWRECAPRSCQFFSAWRRTSMTKSAGKVALDSEYNPTRAVTVSDRLIGLILFGIAALAAWQSQDMMPPWLILAGGVALAW